MRTPYAQGGGVSERWAAWLLMAASTLGMACAAAEPAPDRPRPQAPEYIPPRVLPWDSGSPVAPGDPFSAAADGDWLPSSASTTGPTDAGADVPAPSRAGDTDGAAPLPADAGGEPGARRLDAADAAADGRAH
jgi:hypothetical protein